MTPEVVALDGRPIRISPTALSTWRGCARRWWYEYVAGLRPPSGPAAELGTAVHAAIETYLLGGDWPAGRAAGIARAGVRRLEDLRSQVAAGRAVVEASTPDGLTIGPLPLRGRIDYYCADPGDGVPHVVDFKTTSDVRRRLAEVELSTDPQAAIYAWAMAPGAPVVRVEHLVLATRGTAEAVPVEATLTRAAIEEIVGHAADDAGQMARAAAEGDGEAVAPTLTACARYGGCPHASRCSASPTSRALAASPLGGLWAPTTPERPVSAFSDDDLFGPPVTRPSAPPVPAPPAPAPAPAPDAWALDAAAPAAADAVGAIVPPDAPADTVSDLADLLDAVAAFGRWPGDELVGDLIRAQGAACAVTIDELRAAAVAAGIEGAVVAPPAAPRGPGRPRKAPPEAEVDAHVLREVLESAPTLGGEELKAAWKAARGLARVSDARWSAARAAVGFVSTAGAPGPLLELGGHQAPVGVPVAPPAVPPAPVGLTAERRAELVEVAARAWLDGGTALGIRVDMQRLGATHLEADAITRQAEGVARAALPVTPPPAPSPPTPEVAPASAPRGVLLVDALPAGPTAGTIQLRAYVAAAIEAVERAERCPVDLVDYGKGAPLVASYVAARGLPPLAPGAVVVASSADRLAEVLLPVLARAGWLVVRGVR